MATTSEKNTAGDAMEEKHIDNTKQQSIIAPNDEAQHAAADEKNMTLLQGIKLYPKAVGWSVIFSSALIMEGYDLALLGSLYGNAQFKKKYGVLNPATGKYAVPANWQSALYVPSLHSTRMCLLISPRSNGARAGEVIGLILNGFVSERFGYRKTMVGALIGMIAFIFILFFAPNVQTLVIGEVFCGIPWGMFQTLAPQYASEVAPVVLRPYLTTYVNM
jgi:SP family general alpha glucoside:H+ symporter-like MFS transporter